MTVQLPEITRASTQRPVEPLPPRRSIDGERLIAVFSQLVEPIGRSLPSSSEVVLHDLSLLPNSIVSIYGDVTGRRVGDPATDLLLQKVSDLTDDRMVGYETSLPDGRRIRSSTMIIRDVAGVPVAAFCINSDLSAWLSVQRVVDIMLTGVAPAAADVPRPTPVAGTVRDEPTEMFVRDVDELAAHLIHRAVASIGVPVELMHKRHKVEVVRDLRSRGMFMLRDAVEMIASSLLVSRFTIYNYLNEIIDEEKSGSDEIATTASDTAGDAGMDKA
jgi:predicted transcriptional regulator YheO